MFKKHTLATVIGLCCAFSAYADEFIQHEAHVHGQVELNIAQDGSDVLIEITAPGMDVLGFEHAPSNAQEKALLNQSIEHLEKASSILILNPEAECELTKAHASVGHHEHEDDHHHDDHDQHHNEANHEHHDDAEHNHHDHDADEHAEHSAFDIEYQYSCNHISELTELDLNWFKFFKNTHEIKANIFTDHVQTSATLTPSNTKAKL